MKKKSIRYVGAKNEKNKIKLKQKKLPSSFWYFKNYDSKRKKMKKMNFYKNNFYCTAVFEQTSLRMYSVLKTYFLHKKICTFSTLNNISVQDTCITKYIYVRQ